MLANVVFDKYVKPSDDTVVPITFLTETQNGIVKNGLLEPACSLEEILKLTGMPLARWAQSVDARNRNFLYFVSNNSFYAYSLQTYTLGLQFLGTSSFSHTQQEFTRYNNILYFGGLDSMWKLYYEDLVGSGRYVLAPIGVSTLEISGSTGEFTATLSGSHSLSGTYSYRMTYVINNSEQIVEGNGSTTSRSITASSQGALIGIPKSYNNLVNKVRIYRLDPGQSNYYYLTEVSTNVTSTSTYLDTGTANDTTRPIPTTNNLITGIVSRVSCIYKDKLFFNDGKNKLYFSQNGYPEHISSTSFLTVGETDDEITALIPLDDYLLIVKKSSIWSLSGSNISDFNLSKVATYGSPFYGGTKYHLGVVYFIRLDGIYSYTPNFSIEKISTDIEQDIINYLDKTGDYKLQIIDDPSTGYLWFGIGTQLSFGSNRVYNKIFIYDPATKKWLGTSDTKLMSWLFHYFSLERIPKLAAAYNNLAFDPLFPGLFLKINLPNFDTSNEYNIRHTTWWTLGAAIPPNIFNQKLIRTIKFMYTANMNISDPVNIAIYDLENPDIWIHYRSIYNLNKLPVTFNVGATTNSSTRIKIEIPVSSIKVRGLGIEYEQVGHIDG